MNDAPEADGNGPGVRVNPPLIYAISILAGVVLGRVRPAPVPFDLPGTAIGTVIISIGGLIALWALRQFHVADTDVRPDTPDTALVTGGPYRYSRNPMYIVLTLAQLTVAFWLDNLWVLALTPVSVVMITRLAIVREERYLEQRFGRDYLEYRRRVRRWL